MARAGHARDIVAPYAEDCTEDGEWRHLSFDQRAKTPGLVKTAGPAYGRPRAKGETR
jgi:hypothetical protein